MSERAAISNHLASATDLLGPSFRTLARSVQTGVVLLDASSKPTFANHAARDLFGIDQELSDERALAELARWMPRDDEALHAGGESELRIERDGGRSPRCLLLRCIPFEPEGCGVLVLLEDGAKTAALKASLALASRMRVWSVLRTQVHDLKAPLNALSLHLELLRQSIEEERTKDEAVRADQKAMAHTLRQEITRLGRALDGLVCPARDDEQARALDLRHLVRNVARLLRTAAKSERVHLRVELADVPLEAVVSQDRLTQALLNVSLNALEAAGKGGDVRLTALREDGRVLIRVQDDGPGIPPHLVSRSFDANFTTKEGGTGVGLWVARSLIEADHGRLELRSPGPGGTTFELSFPERKT